MLLSLSIKNYAIIDSVDITFGDGMNVLTGETGAGKSILVGALSMALGYRTSSEYIRTGQSKACVQALFCVEDDNSLLRESLSEVGVDLDDNSVLIQRELYSNGKNICKINNVMVNVSSLKQIGLLLVDIHGQHEHQKILDSSTHLAMLDEYGHSELNELLAETKSAYIQMKKAHSNWKELTEKVKEKNKNRDQYLEIISEIDEVMPEVGEDEVLEEKIAVMQNSEKIFDNLEEVYSGLFSDANNIINRLRYISAKLDNAVAVDKKLNPAQQSFNDASIALDEALLVIRDYKENLEFNQEELDEAHYRLNKIEKLKRKYGENISDILEYRDDTEKLLKLIDNSEIETEKAKNEYNAAKENYFMCSDRLSEKRKKVAQNLSEKLCRELKDLAMPNAVFDVRFERTEDKVSSLGNDIVEFMISTNTGESLKPLTKIASGGEISRIMLALKSIFAYTDKTETLIFDEIDTGISGRTAQIVAQKMADLSMTHQLLCISHLPQIASMANTHILIGKHVSDDRTYTQITMLDRQNRIGEIARMLGGVEVNDTALTHAEEMLKQAENYKLDKYSI